MAPIDDGVDVQRFPPPDFESGYTLPLTHTPAPRGELLTYLDMVVLFAALSLASWLALKIRSRKWLFLLASFSLAYFGFYREGCVCPIGAVQNVTLALFDSGYAIPLSVVFFFLLPLAFTLFFGRAFCAAVCPLGAFQDLALVRPVTIPSWLHHALGLLAYVYLGAAVLFAATGSAFIICEYDPFVAFFRLSGSFNMVVLGLSFLTISLFVGRPYCRFFCPYGVLLRWLSRFSRWRITISPDACIQCRLCEDSCPFGAIDMATPEEAAPPGPRDRRRLVLMMALLPVLAAGGGWIVSGLGEPLARMHATVRLAERLKVEEAGLVEGTTDASEAFRDTGKPMGDLFEEALALRDDFTTGGWILGVFLGAAVAARLIGLSLLRRREDFEANRAGCYACGRCFSYCPIELERRKPGGAAEVGVVLTEYRR
jgi:ferredoxin